MGNRRRGNTMTRFLEDIVDDTKDFVDDVLDRAKDVEHDTRDAVKDMHSAQDGDNRAEVAALQASLEDLSAKVDELARMKKQTDLKSMTKVELQQLAEKCGLDNVNQSAQTKDDMIAAISGS